MKIIFSEYLNNYATYTFGFGVYAILEKGKDLGITYDSGFLPFSGSPEIKNHFYLCRSARINISKWFLNSENKRILKKQTQVFKKNVYKSLKDFEKKEGKENYNLLFKFYLEYFKNIHGEKIMSSERLTFIFSQDFINRIVVYKDEVGSISGSILMVESFEKNSQHLHFWFSAYSIDMKNTGFGLWMFLDEIENLKNIDNKFKKYFYLGTCYGAKAKYKLNFEAVEFFDGETWNSNIKELKNRINNDTIIEKNSDLIKQNTNLF